MPRVAVWLVRASLLHLAVGAILGALYLIWKATLWPQFIATHLGVHQELMLIGFLVQLVIGVAWWILPRPEQGELNNGGAWLCFVLINAGVLLAAAGTSPSWPPLLILAGRICESGAVALFAVLAWNRQRPYRPAARRVLV